ncbi:MAG: hypothetical protein ACRD8Z_23460, partial [Nitrososphaeraceae archaeon]
AMKKDSLTPNKVLAYKNIYKRILNLAQLGFIEEFELVHMHGRRDFKVITKKIDYLIPYILAESSIDDFKALSKYISQAKLDREAFDRELGPRILGILERANAYYESVGRILHLPSEYIPNIKIEKFKQKQQQQPYEWKDDKFTKITHSTAPSKDHQTVIEAQRSAMRSAGIDEDSEITKTLDRIESASIPKSKPKFKSQDKYPTTKLIKSKK